MATLTIRKPILFAALILAASAAPARADLPINVLASFNGTNGAWPAASLTLSADGQTLYGTTEYGGFNFSGLEQSGYGTVFSVPVTGGAPTILATFNGTNGCKLCGALRLVGNTIYGTTQYGGPNYNGQPVSGYGTVFSVPVTGGTPTVLASFSNTNGAHPQAGLTLSGDGQTFYGAASEGGSHLSGTVFSVPVTGGAPTVLASFNGTNGREPIAGLTLSADGTTLYGTAYSGGAYSASGGGGTVFSVPATGGTATVLASFSSASGYYSSAGLTLSGDGNTFYGTTQSGGASGAGTVVSVPVTGGTATALASFKTFINGNSPIGGMTLSPDGNTLYGTTSLYGPGAHAAGTVFSVPVTGGAPTILATFNGTNGYEPWGGLTLVANTLYGTTSGGGANGLGTVFSITLPVPEPASLLLLTLGTAGLLLRRHARKT